MIKIKDFVPEKEKGGIFKAGKVAPFQSVVEHMNSWLQNNTVKVLNIETLLLPNIHEKDEEGSEDAELWTGNTTSTRWYQVIRVWYQEKE